MKSVLSYEAPPIEVVQWLNQRHAIQWLTPFSTEQPVGTFQIVSPWGWLKLSHQGQLSPSSSGTILQMTSKLTRQSLWLITSLMFVSCLLASYVAYRLAGKWNFLEASTYGWLIATLIPSYLVWLYGWKRARGEMRRFHSEVRQGIHAQIAQMKRPKYR